VRAFVYSRWFSPVMLLILCVAVYGDVLSGHRGGVVSSPDGDIATEFVYWRQYGFEALRHGHIAQWNRHVYSGVPFFAGWQAALLYPPNIIYLVLPLKAAINVDLATSTFLAGWFTTLLARKYSFHPVASLLAGAIVSLGGAFFPHVYAGHLATVAAMAWTPLILLAVDDVLDSPTPRGVMLGSFAIAMQVFAGHPQTTFFTAVAAIIYGVIRLVKAPTRIPALSALAIMALAAILLAAAQIVPGLQVSTEGTRAEHTTRLFAAMFSFPPENLATLVAPNLLGDMTRLPYWGRWYYWEANLFIGGAAFLLAIIGLRHGAPDRRRLWATMIAICIVLALGRYTPLFGALYEHIPGFGSFRAYAKFSYESTIFLALLAAAGLDSLIRAPQSGRVGVLAGVVCGALLVAAGMAARGGLGASAIAWVCTRGASWLNEAGQGLPDLVHRAQTFASLQLWTAALLMFATAGLIAWARPCNRAAYTLAALAIVELGVFAHSLVVTFDPASCRPTAATSFRAPAGDYKMWQPDYPPNSAMVTGTNDIWGYDPMVQNRYAELLTYAATGSAADASMYLELRTLLPVFATLGCHIIAGLGFEIPNAAPHATIVYQYAVQANRDKALAAITDANFDARKSVVLDSPPSIAPALPATPPSATVTWTDTDTMRVDATTAAPGILVLTDSYSRFWTAIPLKGSAQQRYEIVPANYAELGIPVTAGHHSFTVTYRPPGFVPSAWVSATGWVMLACGWWRLRRRGVVVGT
jgi:hypothetical protein